MRAVKKAGKYIVIISVLLISVLSFIDIDLSIRNDVLQFLLNIMNLGVLPIAAALLAALIYTNTGSKSILLISFSLFILGHGTIISVVFRLAALADVSDSIFITCVLTSSIIHLFSAITKDSDIKTTGSGTRKILFGMAGIFVLATAIIAASLSGLTPLFLGDKGASVVKQAITWLALTFYLLSGLFILRKYRKTRTDYLYLYLIAVILISIGMFSISAPPDDSRALIWVGRLTQYAGVIYSLAAMISFLMKIKTPGSSLSEAISEFFSDADSNYRMFVEQSTDAIIMLDENLKIYIHNNGASDMFKYQVNGMLDVSFSELFTGESSQIIQSDFEEYLNGGESRLKKPTELIAVDSKGNRFHVELSVSYRKIKTGHTAMYFIRDITYRKKIRDRLDRQNKILQAINQAYESTMLCKTTKDLAETYLGIIEELTDSRCSFIGMANDNNNIRILAVNMLGITRTDIKELIDLSYFENNLDSVCHEIFKLYGNANGGSEQAQDRSYNEITDTSRLIVPVKLGDRLIGVIGAGSKQGEYTDEDRELILALSPTIFRAIQHKRAEERLHDSEQIFNAFMDASPCISTMKDETGRYIYISKAWANTFDENISDFIGKTDYDMLPEPIADNIRDIEKRVLEEGCFIHQVEGRKIPGQGEHYWQTVRFPFKSSDGRAYTGCVAFEITDQKLAENSLRESERLLRAIIESSDDPIFMKDINSRFLIANTALSKSWGLDMSEIIGKNELEFAKDTEMARIIREADIQLMAEGVSARRLFSTPSSEGWRTYQATMTPWRNLDNEVTGLIVVFHEITELKKLESELKLKAEELSNKNKLITDFFINISHEFKTPLSIILLCLDLIRTDQYNKKHLDMIKQNSYRLGRLVANLLDITKLDAGFMEPRWEYKDIIELLRQIMDSCSFYFQLNEIRSEFKSTVETCMTYTDSVMIERIMLNLLSNALKHTPKCGRIDVSCEVIDEKIMISVKDNGEGIPKEKQEIIFDRFKQVETSLVRSREGCGLGLAITKSLVNLLKGTISVISSPGEGSEFKIRLPVIRQQLTPSSQEQAGMDLSKRVQIEFSDINFSR